MPASLGNRSCIELSSFYPWALSSRLSVERLVLHGLVRYGPSAFQAAIQVLSFVTEFCLVAKRVCSIQGKRLVRVASEGQFGP